MELIKGLKAISNPTRLRILHLLRNPAPLPELAAYGGVKGLTGKALLAQLKCAQPSLNEHMQVLIHVGLIESRKAGRWVVYTRDEERIRQLKQTIMDQLLPPAGG